MVIKGNIRGNGGQLADYLTRQGENDHIRILEVDGRDDADRDYLFTILEGFSLNEKLTKSKQGLYHAQINPAYNEDKYMKNADWQKAADILGHALGFDDQRRVIVLHHKKDRVHAHVVWERFDYQQSKMKTVAHNYKAHDKARGEMERIFSQEKTPQKNVKQPEIKERLTEIWNKSKSGKEFQAKAKDAGYRLARGAKRPFMLVDNNGRSFDLVRQLKGIKTKDVRERLKGLKLGNEKKVIEAVRAEQKQQERQSQQSTSADKTDMPKTDKERVKKEKSSPDNGSDKKQEKENTAEQRQQAKQDFKDNGNDTSKSKTVDWIFYEPKQEQQKEQKQQFADNGQNITNDSKSSARKVAHEFAENRMTAEDEREAEKGQLFKEMMIQLEDHEQSRSRDRAM